MEEKRVSPTKNRKPESLAAANKLQSSKTQVAVGNTCSQSGWRLVVGADCSRCDLVMALVASRLLWLPVVAMETLTNWRKLEK